MNGVNVKKKVGLARRVTRLAGSPFCGGRVTILADATFLHTSTFAHPAGSTRQGETIRVCASRVGSGKGVNYFFR